MDVFTDKCTGVQFCMKTGNPSAEKILEEGITDHALIKWCKQFISKEGVFVDIGAHIGKYCILLGKECKEVYAFEPQKSNFDCLNIGLCVNNMYNVKAEKVALGEKEGKVQIRSYSEDGTDCTVLRLEEEKIIEEEEVPMRTLDSYEIEGVDFIKISVRGSELSVIKGAALTLIENNFPPFLFEVWSHDSIKEDSEHLISFVKNLGYRVVSVSGVEGIYLASDHPLRVKKRVEEVQPTHDNKELCDKYEAGEDLKWEEWYGLAKYYRISSKNKESYDCAIRGLEMVPPEKEYLFYEEISIAAYYIDKRKEGFQAAENVILSRHAPWSTRNLTLSNEGFYMSAIPVIRKVQLKYDMPIHYTPSSASVIKNGSGFRINLRGINYYLSEQGYGVSRHGDNVIRTINYLLETDSDLNIISGVEVIDKSGVKLYPKNILGMEDIRLFGPNYFFCTYLELNESRTPQIGWGTYDPKTGSVIRMVPLMVGTELKCEKNWLPFVDNGDIYIIYAVGPFQLYKLDKETGNIEKVKHLDLGNGLTDLSLNVTRPDRFIDDFRGSASPIPYKDYWLMTIHQVYHSEPRKYFHRFVAFSKDFTVVKFSVPFYFDKVGVEFNLSICESEDGMLMSYSHGDASSTIAIVDYRLIDSMLGL